MPADPTVVVDPTETFTSVLQVKRFLEHRVGAAIALSDRTSEPSRQAAVQAEIGLIYLILARMARTPEARGLNQARSNAAFAKSWKA